MADLPKVDGIIYRVYDQEDSSENSVKFWWRKQVKTYKELGVLGDTFLLAEEQAKDINEALQILQDTAIPYCGATAVAYTGLLGGIPQSVIDAKEAYDNAKAHLEKTVKDTHATIVDAKSKTIGCKKCRSQINRLYIGESCTCPVCSEPLLAETYRKRRDSALKQLTAAEKVWLPFATMEWPAVKPGKCYIVGGYEV